MSLINDMLNDLESRRSSMNRQPGVEPFFPGQQTNNHSERNTLLLCILFCVLVLMTSIIAWQYITNKAYAEPVVSEQTIQQRNFEKMHQQRENNVESKLPAKQSTNMASAINAVSQNPPKKVKLSVKVNGVPGDSKVLREKKQVKPRKKIEDPRVNKKQLANSKSSQKQRVSETIQEIPIKPVKTTLPLSKVVKDKMLANEARRLIGMAKYDEAEEMLTDVVFKKPISIHSVQVLFSLYLFQQEFAKATQMLEKLPDANTKESIINIMKSRLLLKKGDAKAAVKLLLENNPPEEEKIAYFELLAQAAQRSGQYVLSQKTYQTLLRTSDSQGDWWVGLAVAFDAQGKPIEAKKAYQKALLRKRITAPLEEYARQRLATL